MTQQNNLSSRHCYDLFESAANFNLCGRCLNDYRSTSSFLIRRNNEVERTDTCLICNVRRGFEYFIVARNSKLK